MTVSDDCINAIKQFEGFRSTAYKCPAGVWTIGYGHTGGVTAGMTISQASATLQLRRDLSKFENFINNLDLNLNQNQFDAVVDFVFNLGSGAFLNSTLYALIKANANEQDIANQFKRWVYSNGTQLPGLVKRRNWEYNKYLQK